tara:strand:+ start:72476 stop:73990 length:1515 start_codon:yes stop_codon:yes gene_type:complete
MQRTLLVLLLCLWAILPGSMAHQAAHAAHEPETDQPQQRTADPAQLESDGIDAMERAEYEEAERLFRALIESQPKLFVGHYNLASALSMQGDGEAAVYAMQDAIRLGFTDLAQIRRDPDLQSFRETEFFMQLVRSWGMIIDTRRKGDVENLMPLMRRKFEQRTNEDLKIELLSSHDTIATDQALAELELLASWGNSTLFPEVGALNDQPWIVVTLPDRDGFAAWATKVLGPGAGSSGASSSIGGAYEHSKRRLVAQDLGATLRHEFIHVLHWRDMNRLGQVHATWIQEGLASLVEDYEVAGPSSAQTVVPVASWRTNIVKRMKDRRVLPTIQTLADTEIQAFTRTRPLAKYAQARTIMLYLLDQHELSAFYDQYTQHFDDDPTGIASLEAVLGKEITQIEDDFRTWIDGLDMVAETGSDLQATLGIEIETGSGDGVVVTGLPSGSRARTGLHLKSVITAINDQPTRDLFELIRVLSQYKPGDTVTLHHRRGTVHSQSQATLIEK